MKAKHLLESHHTVPRYSIPVLDSPRKMPWSKWQGQGKTQQWGEWEKPAKKGKEKEEKGKQPILYGWDGKKIEVKKDGIAKSGSSSGYSSSDASLREENRRIKEVVRNILGNEEQTEEDIQALREFAKVDPREDLKERQRQLNSERSLNKTARIKEVMEEQETNFKSWRDTYTAGLEQEEKRYQSKMAELREELKAAEKGDAEEKDQGAMDEEQTELSVPVYVQQELSDLRNQMRQFMNYAHQMEQKNAALTDQVTTLVATLQSRERIISPAQSPQHPVPRMSHTEVSSNLPTMVPDEEKRERSRSPSRKAQKIEHKLDPEEFKCLLETVSERHQAVILNAIHGEPEKFSSIEDVKPLIRAAVEADKKLHLTVVQEDLAKGGSALVPFGKMHKSDKTERSNVSPYGRVRQKSKEDGGLEGLDM